jgi:HEPN domain-containing protein
MKRLTDEWVFKAEEDYRSADGLLYQLEVPAAETASFHCQQCAEKYLKAFLQEKGIEFPRKHDLIPLMELCKKVDSSFETLRLDLGRLDRFGVAIRYPGTTASVELAENAYSAATRVRKFVRKKLRLR